MPELPEVETIRVDLNEFVVDKKISTVTVLKTKMVHGGTAASFMKGLTNNHITRVERRGKLLIFCLKNGQFMLLHLKMTGQLIYQDRTHLIAGGHTMTDPEANFVVPNQYTHINFDFADGSHLYFNDLRQFGYVELTNAAGKERAISKMGIEPLQSDYTLAAFAAALHKHQKTAVKTALMDQRHITGIGNIYADESCFLAGILPTRLVSTLSDDDLKALYDATKKIITAAIKHRGTTFNDYRDTKGRKGNYVPYLMVYGRGGQECKRCKQGIIHKIKLAGRGTTYCSRCQK